MIEEVLSWVALISAKKILTATTTSNLILFMYCFQYYSNRKARFLCAFLICEAFSFLPFAEQYTNAEYYAILMMIYFYLLTFCYAIRDNTKILACVIMTLFEFYMIFDAILYPNVYTFAWNWYADIILAIHTLLFLSATNFRTAYRNISDTLLHVRDAYNHAFVMYNIR